MVKEIVIGKGAAGLRRSAIAERIRLREEWSSLKGTDDETEPAAKVKRHPQTFSRNLQNVEKNLTQKGCNVKITFQKDKENYVPPRKSLEVLRGVVALVDIGSSSKALALRAALKALGATVVLTWSPLVTHLVWAQGGCRNTRATARGLACNVVSPLWVEACAASGRRISEKVFPSTARASDLPSPSTLCSLLKRAEKENWQLPELLLDSDELRPARLRISSDTDDNTKNRTSDSDTTCESVDAETRVNTAPRRALPVSISPLPINPKSKRKLFTARAEADDDETDAEDSPTKVAKSNTRPVNALKHLEKTPSRPIKSPSRTKKSIKVPERQKAKRYNLTPEQKKNLEKAGRLAKRLAAEQAVHRREPQTQKQRRRISSIPRIVLSGMPKSQHRAIVAAIQALNGKIQRNVNHRTTHVLLGTCKKDKNVNVDEEAHRDGQEKNKETPLKRNLSMKSPTVAKTISVCDQCNSPRSVLIQELENENVIVSDFCSQVTVVDENVTLICSTHNRDANKDTNADRTDKNTDTGDNPVSSDDNTIRSDNNRHVLIGTCKKDNSFNVEAQIHQNEEEKTKERQRKNKLSMKSSKVAKTISVCDQCNSPRSVLIQELENENVIVSDFCSQVTVVDENVTLICSTHNRDANKDTNADRTDKNTDTGDNPVSSDDNTIRSDNNRHVLVGTCKKDNSFNVEVEIHQNEEEKTKERQRKNKLSMKSSKVAKTVSVCDQCNSPRSVLIQELENENVIVSDFCSQVTVADDNVTLICSKHNRDANKDTNADGIDKSCVTSDDNAVTNDDNAVRSDDNAVGSNDNSVRSDDNAIRTNDNAVRSNKTAVTSDDIVIISDNNDNDQNHNISDLCEGIVDNKRLRTLKTLLGAARGCRVLHAQWALDSQKEKQWQPHIGYEVTHLLKICRKARLERSALGKMHKKYAYDVFRGMRVSVSEIAEQREAAIQLLSLCGAEIIDPSQNAQGYTQDGVETQNGGTQVGADFSDVLVRVGKHHDEVSSKWVFDSVAAGRPRTTRRYINGNVP